MRTTVTLDPDVERLIRDAMRERGLSFKEALNEAARIGLRGKPPKRTKPFTQKSFRMGAPQDFRWDKALAVADALEDEELNRKLALRK
ncbi:MAG TPA: antitoxin [Solibacterales bacterium]|nr:antitoxin [Bryobacterales bacterium]